MKKYRQLSLNERENLYILLQEGKDMKAIASKLERDQSTIYRELKRNKANKELGYLPNKAHEKAQARVARHGNKISRNSDLKEKIVSGLRDRWSPDVIAGRLKTIVVPFFGFPRNNL